MKLLAKTIFILIILSLSLHSQNHRIIESTQNYLTIEFSFDEVFSLNDTLIKGIDYTIIRGGNSYGRNYGEPLLPDYFINLGLPPQAKPILTILDRDFEIHQNKMVLPYSAGEDEIELLKSLNFDYNIYSKNEFFPSDAATLDEPFMFRFVRVVSVSLAPFQFNPVNRNLMHNKRVLIRIDYNLIQNYIEYEMPVDPMTMNFVSDQLINPEEAVNWVHKSSSVIKKEISSESWYSPQKKYLKLYLNKKGMYKITYEDIISAGMELGDVSFDNIELWNIGELIPVHITDANQDSLFNEGDYFEFLGTPPPPTPYTYQNIYNLQNVYWLTFDGDKKGKFYKLKDGYPKGELSAWTGSLHTIHYEQDVLYERLGYAPDEKRDFWYWGKASAFGGQSTQGFEARFPGFKNINTDSNYVNVRVNMHGITNNLFCNPEHRAYIYINNKLIGEQIWDGQTESTFEKRIFIGAGGVSIYPQGNILSVWVKGDICPNTYSDEIRINWIEFDYWKVFRAEDEQLNFFSSNDSTGKTRFWVWLWEDDSIKIFKPETADIIVNPLFLSQYQNAFIFDDSLSNKTEFFITGITYNHLKPDSIVRVNNSDLKNISNGADYIIISHPKFIVPAQSLANYRSSRMLDSSIVNPRVVIVNVNDIYDEFSYGLLDPFALHYFVRYAFENWATPAPSYIALFGDMSYDYRKILPTSRPNFVPSIPYQSREFGQSASDNLIAAVAGDDVYPDLAIGRISCETVGEAEILVDKIINYPSDASKKWKQNVLLMASGVNASDENYYGFNDASMTLQNLYLTKNGFEAVKIFRYPNKPEYIPFMGEGPEIRHAFNQGAAIANYYGHGGGYQWDLTFLNDDIYLLENQGRLPVIFSVTCYTAHFDNQDVFGEQFNKVPGKGSLAFFGSSGLTNWEIGKQINNLIFNDIFNNRNYNLGKSILFAKGKVPNSLAYRNQLAVLTLLGDPGINIALPTQPDFEVKSNGISISPSNPLIEDTVAVKIFVRNYGVTFPEDSVTVELFAASKDTSYLVDRVKMPSFGILDSTIITWIPIDAGLYELTVRVNDDLRIAEPDISDNSASAQFAVYSINEPNIISPVNGHSTSNNYVDFLFADIGFYIDRSLEYFIEIDTSRNFSSPIIKSSGLLPDTGLVKWRSPQLIKGEYFWRARIFDGEEYGKWSEVRSIIITDNPKSGYYAEGNALKQFKTDNVNYSSSRRGLVLNINPNPPRPSNDRFLEDIFFDTTAIGKLGLTTITTDGTYLYFANMWYFQLSDNVAGKTRIYKVGTGNNGTEKGKFYGIFSDFYDRISNQMFYHGDGGIYIITGSPYDVKRIDVLSEEIEDIHIPTGFLRWDDSKIADGSFYVTSDGYYVYNISSKDTLGSSRYILRILDPQDNWRLVKPDMLLTGTTYPGFSGFFAAEGYIYPYEYYYNGFMRKIRISDGVFEDEWLTRTPFQSYYAWTYDWINDRVYASTYRSSGYKRKFSKFAGKYFNAKGSITTEEVGPAQKWNSLNFEFETTGSAGNYQAVLEGYNNNSKSWDTLGINLLQSSTLLGINPLMYTKLRVEYSLIDSSFGASLPMVLKSFHIDYNPPPEVFINSRNITFTPDSVLQGLPTKLTAVMQNIGYSKADSTVAKFFLNGADSAFLTKVISIGENSSSAIDYIINTALLIFNNNIKVIASVPHNEFFTYNNIAENSFYVVRDSIPPKFTITFDDKEILNGDIISAKPKVRITLEDNSPLPLDTSYFTIIHNNKLLYFSNPDLEYFYMPYPNSKAEILWQPELNDGRHVLEVLAKDASGNFFDSTFSRSIFFVYNKADLLNVFNYPNPFKTNTYFTFEIRGIQPPEEFYLKIYTIAGRLIKEITVPQSSLTVGFNHLFWDGRDEDGDEVANGVYFYKIVTKNNGVIKTVTEKLAKIK
jgi:hypothetical protein